MITHAGVILSVNIENEWRVALVQGDEAGKWGLPKGHTEQGESLERTAIRELYEETGVELNSVDPNNSWCCENCMFYAKTLEQPVELIPQDNEIRVAKWVSMKELLSLSPTIMNRGLRIYTSRFLPSQKDGFTIVKRKRKQSKRRLPSDKNR